MTTAQIIKKMDNGYTLWIAILGEEWVSAHLYDDQKDDQIEVEIATCIELQKNYTLNEAKGRWSYDKSAGYDFLYDYWQAYYVRNDERLNYKPKNECYFTFH